MATTTYDNVAHQKSKGSLVISDLELRFLPNDLVVVVGGEAGGDRVVLPWRRVSKHQVSPATHPRSLLRVVATATSSNDGDDGGIGYTLFIFTFPDRESLERARRDVSARLAFARGGGRRTADEAAHHGKRPRPTDDGAPPPPKRLSTPPSSHYVDLDHVALIAARSSLLASDPALRAQHRHLVLDTCTIDEDDFWDTHGRLVADEYAKISGKASGGMSSDIRSSLDLGISASAMSSFGNKGVGGGGGTKKNDTSEGGRDGGGGGGGGSSSNAAGVVHLGVEEMRQIFIMYPAVHRAYEEKVPLELSEEQFWRRYLESEYFHRDRGRIGAHMRKVDEREGIERERRRIRAGSGPLGTDAEVGVTSSSSSRMRDEEMKRKENDVTGEEEAKNRLAAAGIDDLFSRYESKHGTSSTHHHGHHSGRHRHHHHHPHGRHHHHNRDHRHHHPNHHGGMGARLAVGKFDLAATADVERGDRFLGSDLHPPPERDSAGSRIINKYNRHWAIVLHPSESIAGIDLREVAARSVRDVAMAEAPEKGFDEDARVNGGCDGEMRRLVGFANARGRYADFARGVGDDVDEDLMELRLRDVDAYAGKFGPSDNDNGKEGDLKLHLQYAKILAATQRGQTEPILREKKSGRARGFCNAPTLAKPFPDPKIGRGLLEALTKKMSADSRTEADVQQLADSLPDEFKTKLAAFFRRASELLRHFFSLRSVFSENENGNGGTGQSESQKNRLANIVTGMEKLHGEMYAHRSTTSVLESKMFKPIMDQLDWAFKLHREDSSKSKGGFVTVSRGGFVPVAH